MEARGGGGGVAGSEKDGGQQPLAVLRGAARRGAHKLGAGRVSPGAPNAGGGVPRQKKGPGRALLSFLSDGKCLMRRYWCWLFLVGVGGQGFVCSDAPPMEV